MIEVISLVKEYNAFGVNTKALDNLSFSLKETGLVGIGGESGGGKTTLLNCLALIDNPTSGEIKGINKSDCALVFQDYQLIETLSVYDNLLLFSSHSN